ncbi:MAG: acetyl-CoA C-acyltransferase [Lewinellaceae bacterium]|nr:acetyl-CoA C-acyltransferase [Lewinellaceae bacterium]
MTEAYIFDALRTPWGQTALYEVKPVDLLARVLEGLQRRQPELDLKQVDDLLIGCVTPTGDQGANIAKAALLQAGWPPTTSGMTLNRYEASSLEAISLGAAKIRAGWAELIVAGGIESMSRVPLGSAGGALGFDPGVLHRVDYVPTGISADLLATCTGFTREELDAFALHTYHRAVHAGEQGYFHPSLQPIYDQNGLLILDRDEWRWPAMTADLLQAQSPAFAELGALGFDQMALHHFPAVEQVKHLHTPATMASSADGAALLLLGSQQKGKALGLTPRARIRTATTLSLDPAILLRGAHQAAAVALSMAGMEPTDIDLWECHESYAAIPLHCQRMLQIPADRLNVNGGAIALGAPLGAAGAFLLSTLIDELERRDLNTGLATIAAKGGMGVAMIIERQ